MRSLTRRITLLSIGVAVAAVVITGLLALQLVRHEVNAQARETVAREADALAASPVATTIFERREQQAAGPDGTQVGYIDQQGDRMGAAAAYLSEGDIQELLNGQPVSTTVRQLGTSVLVEARPVARGGAVVVAQPTTLAASTSRALTKRIAIALAVGLAAAGLASVALARRLARPLQETAAGARRIAAGERGVSLPTSDVAEIADVTGAIETLDAALTTSEARQREFLMSVSHEVRTPLTAIRGYAEGLRDGVVPVDRLDEVGATIVAESIRLDRFVSDILEMARLESDDFALQPSTVSLDELIAAVGRAWSPVAAHAEVALDTSALGHVTVEADAMRLRQIIDGLVENALRATPPGGSVSVTCGPADRPDLATVVVQDTGPGLTADDLGVIFEPGALRDRYRDDRSVGTGVGLSIAHRLASRMGITLTVSSQPGIGTRFTLTLVGTPTTS